jgi:competence protein ComEA
VKCSEVGAVKTNEKQRCIRKEKDPMRKSQTITLLAFLIAAVCGGAFADATTPAAAGVVNINTADASQIANLPRVGLKVAQRVIDYRTAHGPFHNATDLMQVKGFGQKRFATLSPYLAVEGKTTLSSKVAGSRKPRKSRQPTNTASK